MLFSTKKLELPRPDEALKGRADKMRVPAKHTVLGNPLEGPFPAHLKQLVVGMGCFWGAERKFWELPGVYTTAVGYAGGVTPNPTYEEVCSGGTGHTEVVLVVYDPAKISLDTLLRTFWESHDPTQGMRQQNDVGTQYRSALYWSDEETKAKALASRDAYSAALKQAGVLTAQGEITTELAAAPVDAEASAAPAFFYAEGYHQQYLQKNPNGYCGLEGTGVSCPIGVGVRA